MALMSTSIACIRWFAAAAATAALLGGCGGGKGDSSAASAAAGTIRVLSNRADLVSGGDALVEVVPPSGVDASTLTMSVGTRDLTASFAKRANGRYMGLVSGLADGANTLTAQLPGGASSSIVITNHPNSGPILYGPQIGPWKCDAGATDAACNRPVSYAYLYKSTDPAKTALQPYDPSHPAADVANTTTDAGTVVPFVVRVETGVIDRDYYNVAVLFDPATPWQPWAPQRGWNGKMLYAHGAGAGMGFGQLNSVSSGNVLNAYALGKGFAVLSTALNDTGHNANIAVQAEAMMMLREHFIETYGEYRYAIGTGSSGGALAQQWVANAYPGTYDGIIVGASFPDLGSTTNEVEDCSLIGAYFSDSTQWGSGVSWTADAQKAAEGHIGAVCADWNDHVTPLGLPGKFGYPQLFDPSHQGLVVFPGIAPTAIGGCDAPTSVVYNAQTNRAGVRCTVQDYASTVLGKRASDGFANRAYSNVGVQYGLAALAAGTITPAQFVDLNAKIGSHTIDDVLQPARTAADAGVVANAYRTGWVDTGNGLTSIPILDVRSPDTSGIHHQFRSWAVRARLERAQGHHKNQVIWFNSGKSMNDALDAMDRWLAAIEVDKATAAGGAKVVADRPASLVDLCGTSDGTGLTMRQCTGVSDGSTRMAAGGPLADDTLECTLKPLDRASYPVVFTDAQWSQLQSTFTNGVCDYASTAAPQPTSPWQTYLSALGELIFGGASLAALH